MNLMPRWGLGALCAYFMPALLTMVTLTACGESSAPAAESTALSAERPVEVPAPAEDTAVASAQEAAEASPEVPAQPARKDVLHYFRQLPEPYTLPFTIRRKDRLWVAQHLPSGEEQQAFVDLKNGYMELAHTQAEGASESVQIALFRMAEAQPMLAICRTQAELGQVQQTCACLRPEHAEQLDWTEYTLPVFTPYDFFSPDAEAQLDSPHLEDAFPILLKLPQHGTDLLVQLYLGRRFHYCGEAATKSEKALCPLFDEMERRSFTLRWNRQAGRFE